MKNAIQLCETAATAASVVSLAEAALTVTTSLFPFVVFKGSLQPSLLYFRTVEPIARCKHINQNTTSQPVIGCCNGLGRKCETARGGVSKSQSEKPEFAVAAHRSCGARPVAHLLLLYNRFITWLRVKSVSPSSSLPPGEQRAQSSEDLDADCTGLMKSKSLTLSQTLEALRCIIAADRESNRLRERMRTWHRTHLSHKRKEKKERSSVRC